MNKRQFQTNDFSMLGMGFAMHLIFFVCGVDKEKGLGSSIISKPAKPLLRMLNSGGSFFVRRARR